MKKLNVIICTLSLLLTVQFTFAQPTKPKAENEVAELKASIKKLESTVLAKEKEIETNKRNIEELTRQNSAKAKKLDSLESKIDGVNNSLVNINKVNKEFGTKIDTTNDNVSKNTDSVHTVLIYGSVGLLLVIAITIIIFLILRRRIGEGDLDLHSVKEASKKLTEQSIALDTKLAEVLERQLKTDENVQAISANASNTEVDHSLVLTVANELMRIKQNLAFMDSKTKGVSQLKNRADAISAALISKGYEVPDLINTEYKEGMNFDAVMEEDEDMEPGVMRIKRVTQPCVMYKGKMIQTAKVVVAYNPEE